MKKKVLHFVQCSLVKISLFSAICPLQAQVSNPSSWQNFVNSNENVMVSDTFRLQTFGDSEWDNWEYTTSGKATVSPEDHTLELPVRSNAAFTSYSLSIYNKVEIHTYIKARNLTSKKKLIFQTFREGKTESINVPLENLLQDGYQVNHITKNPSLLTIQTGQPGNPETCSFILDSIYATGNIPTYSLFTGTGNWNDTTRWSHLPPLRHRNALINGNVNIAADTYCNNATISAGDLIISPQSRLTLNNLDLYGTEATIHSNGEINISNCITLHKTFDKAGKWYFISFPFDVYPTGIDPRFAQKDATPNDGGNYFYVQSYNGDKRASANQSAGNWEVVPIRSIGVPLFEKNKGYLIALDEKAADRTLSFSSQPGDIPEDFARTGLLAVPIESSMTSENQENYGWYLCGNPLPAPLVLSQIEKNIALDGKVYIYDGRGYKSYSLDSNYALPPFSAFFVKTSAPTEIKVVSDQAPTKATNIIQTDFPLVLKENEPCQSSQSSGLDTSATGDILFRIKDRSIYLENVPETGLLRLVNMTGNCVLQRKIQEGSQTIPFTCEPGIYILQIRSSHHLSHHKVILQ